MRLVLGLSRNSLLLSPFIVLARHPKKSERSQATWPSRAKDDTIVDIVLLALYRWLGLQGRRQYTGLFFYSLIDEFHPFAQLINALTHL